MNVLQGITKRRLSVTVALVCAALSVCAINGQRVFAPDGFDYSAANFDKFTYTYTDATGAEVTVPLTTPATTREAMIALVREVFTNPDIPGRRWIYGDDEVSYVVNADTYPAAMILYGIPEGDYTPKADGLTMLLVEGVDDPGDYVGSTSLDNDNLDLVKSIRVVTSREVIPADNTVTGASGEPLSCPGYLFNIKQPLYKFYFMTKGKPRRMSKQLAPFCNMFEEYSPNLYTSDSHSHDVYAELMEGHRFEINHDCSSVFCNPGHIMKMEGEGGSAVAINMSVFIPYYRNYDDSELVQELYTWYHPDYYPFIYYYAITLEAAASESDEEGMYDIDLQWKTNFREYFETSVLGEYYVYRVVDGVRQTDPIELLLSRDPDCTTVEGARVLSNSADGVRVMYREPLEELGRNIYYIVEGKPLELDTDYTRSNIAKVTLPGTNVDERFMVSIKGDGNSTFRIGKLENAYDNTITLINRPDLYALSAQDIRLGGVFTVTRSAGGAGRRPRAPQQEVGHIEVTGVDRSGLHADVFTCRAVETGDEITLIASRTGDRAGMVTDPDGSLSLLDWTDSFSERIADDNTQPAAYTYQVTYDAPATDELPEVSVASNRESITVLTASMQLAPMTFTADEVARDEVDHSLAVGGYTARVLVENHPGVSAYRVRTYGNPDTGADDVLAVIQNAEGVFTLMMPNAYGTFTATGESVTLQSGDAAYVTVPLSHGQWNNSAYLAAEACSAVEGDRDSYRTYGSPAVQPTSLPRLDIGVPYITINTINSWYINKMTVQTLIDGDGGVGSWQIGRVDHYALWRSFGDADETVLHNSLTPPPYAAPDYIQAEYADDDSAFGPLALRHRDGFNDAETRPAQYRARAYIRVYDPLARDAAERYMIVEAEADGYYSGELTTGLETIVTGTDEALTLSGDTLCGRGPIEVFDTFGRLVAAIADALAARPLPSLPAGVYIARNAASALKIIIR